MLWRGRAGVAGVLLLATLGVAADESSCPAGAGRCAAEAKAASNAPTGSAASAAGYHWPRQQGRPGCQGASPHIAPSILAGPAWNWTEPHGDMIQVGPLLDDALNIYVTTFPGRVYKFSPEGKVLWQYYTEDKSSVPSSPILHDGSLYLVTLAGYVVALDLKTGVEVWSRRVANKVARDPASVFAEGSTIVVAAALPTPLEGEPVLNSKLLALDARSGELRWSFAPNFPLTNFQAASGEDGTLVFQDQSSTLYRLKVSDGSLIWRTGNTDRISPTMAAPVVAEGIVVSGSASNFVFQIQQLGILQAFNLSTGRLLWRQAHFPTVTQSIAVGRLADDAEGELSVVVGMGARSGKPMLLRGLERGLPHALASVLNKLSLQFPKRFSSAEKRSIAAYDLWTGEPRWKRPLPDFHQPAAAGDSERAEERHAAELKASDGLPRNPVACAPEAFAQPVIAGDGSAIVPAQDGNVYVLRNSKPAIRHSHQALRELPLDNVRFFEFGDGFRGPVAVGPGLLAVTTCSGHLNVFRS